MLFLVLGMLLGTFLASMRLVFSTPSLQWPGMDGVIWPTALVLLIVASIAAPLPLVPYCKRAISKSPYKRCFAIGYFFVVLYALGGIGTLILLPFRAASGI